MRANLTLKFAALGIFAGLTSLGINATSLAQSQTNSPPAAAVSDAPPSQQLPGSDAIERLTSPRTLCPCAVEEGPAPPAFGGPLHERSKLTGDWFGYRSRLRDRGITVDLSTTQFYQGVTSGGLERSFSYGGRNDYFLNLDGEK